MDLEQLRQHMDSRFDRMEQKLGDYAKEMVGQQRDIDYLKGFARLAIMLFISGAGFFAVAYFHK